MELGLKVTKVHRALKFKQSPWLKQYIDFNTNKRKEGNTSFEKDFFNNNNNKTNDLILNLTPENVTQHSRIVTTTRKEAQHPLK